MTTFPPPPAGHAWHNPDNLTPEQVGEGYRLLLESEIVDRTTPQKIHLWDSAMEKWNEHPHYGDASDFTYRVPIATWPLPSPVEPMPDAAEALAIVRAMAEWSRNRKPGDMPSSSEQLIAIEDRARALFPQTNSDTKP